MAISISKNVSDKKELESSTLNAITISSWGVFFVVFFAILREGFETAIFLISSLSITGTFSYIGFFLGAILAILIGYLIVIQGRKVDIRNIFKYSTLLLVFLASGMIAYGTHEVEEYIVKSEIIEDFNSDDIYRPWDILQPKDSLSESDTTFMYTYDGSKGKYVHLFHDKGSVGVFLKGFFGYNSNPNLPELVLWLLSLFFGLRMWRGFYY